MIKWRGTRKNGWVVAKRLSVQCKKCGLYYQSKGLARLSSLIDISDLDKRVFIMQQMQKLVIGFATGKYNILRHYIGGEIGEI